MVQPLQVMVHAFVAVSQTSPARQVLLPASQRSAASLHVSVPLQVTASAHTRVVPTHTAEALQASIAVQNRPSSQLAPVFALQPVVDVAGAQIWHWFAGFRVEAA
jgi:hypothetical protein